MATPGKWKRPEWLTPWRIVEGGAVIAGFVGLVSLPFQVGKEIDVSPEIHSHAAQVDDPFAVTFSIRNPGMFTMHIEQVECFLIRAEAHFPNGAPIHMSAGLMRLGGVPSKLEAGSTDLIHCIGTHFIAPDPVVQSARVTVSVWYNYMGRSRYEASEVMNWDSVSRQWTEGAVVN